MSSPSWVADAVFYQIFPDRFANGDTVNDPVKVQTWGTVPSLYGFQGGDLRGIIQGLSYLDDLGVNAIYLNPVFFATTNHRYNTSDYYRIDPKLGTMDDFHQLIREAHDRGIRVILDGVFNHTGRGFFAFQDILENGEDSSYIDWYHVHGFPLDAYGSNRASQYEAWWGLKGLPKLNTDTEAVRQYIFDVARFWLEQGTDGWRLDVPNEIDDDTFWQEFRTVVKSTNPDAYLVGEIWTVDPRWVGDGHFDGLMHYPFRQHLLDHVAFGKTNGAQFSSAVGDLIRRYPAGQEFSQFLTIGNHDTERIFSLCGEDSALVRLMFILQFSYPGAPVIYYGDEVGLPGGKDPDNRRAFPWDQARWVQPIRSLVQDLIRIRKDSAALRRGRWIEVPADNQAIAVFGRSAEAEIVVVAANATGKPQDVSLKSPEETTGKTWHDLLTGTSYAAQDGELRLSLPPKTSLLLQGRMPPDRCPFLRPVPKDTDCGLVFPGPAPGSIEHV